METGSCFPASRYSACCFEPTKAYIIHVHMFTPVTFLAVSARSSGHGHWLAFYSILYPVLKHKVLVDVRSSPGGSLKAR